MAATVSDHKGNDLAVFYFERKVGEETRIAAAHYPDDEVLTFSVIRSVCARLGIDPREFGLELG